METAAGNSPAYGVPAVEGAAKRLFTGMHSACDAGDRERLVRISDPGLMADWNRRRDGYAADGKRQRVQVLNGPRLDYVSLMADRGLVRLSGRFRNYAAFGGVWTRLTGGGEPAGPPVRLGSPPPVIHAQPLANHPRTYETDH